MTRLLYGGSGGDLIAQISTDGDYTPASAALTVWHDTAADGTGGTQETDLLAADGTTAITTVTMPDAGPPRFYGKDGYTGPYVLRDSDGNNWRVDPSDLASRVGGVAKVTFGGTDHTGNVTIPDVNWTNVSGATDFPAVVAAGATTAAARTAIAAVGTADKNQPNGVAGLDTDGLLDPAVFASSIDLSGYAELTDLGVQVEAIATGDDSNLAAALASVSSTLGVNGFIAVKVAGS